MKNIYEAWMIALMPTTFILGVVVINIIATVRMKKSLTNLNYKAFIAILEKESTIEYWENILLNAGYSVEYVMENAVKYRDEHLESYKLSLEDVNMTYKQYLKYLKLINKHE